MFHKASLYRAVKLWLISLAFFGLLALLLACQFSYAASVSLQWSLLMAAAGWLPWALVTPLLFRLVFSFPIERGNWKSAFAIHLGVGFLILSYVIWMGDAILPMNRPPPGPPPESFSDANKDPRYLPPPMHQTGWPIFFHLRTRLPVYLAILSVGHAFYFYRRGQDRERQSLSLETSLAKARLEALKLQVQPHFLFNSLNSIAELIHKDPEAADRMVVALSGLLRASLETSGEQELPLYREVAVLEKYLSLEKVRLAERLQVTIDIPSDLRFALVPTLLLQPVVENAVRHGLEPKAGPGTLLVKAFRVENELHLTVSDDGLGLPEGLVLREGIGLSNTRKRLEELYGNQASINIQTAKARKGVTVRIVLPLNILV